MVSPVDGGLVACRDHIDNIRIFICKRHSSFELSLIAALVVSQDTGRVFSAPRAIRITDLGGNVGTQHHFESEALLPDHCQHTLGMHIAGIEPQRVPVALQNLEVAGDFGGAGKHPRIRALAVAKPGVTNRSLVGEGDSLVHGIGAYLNRSLLSHKPQYAPTSPSPASPATFQGSSKDEK